MWYIPLTQGQLAKVDSEDYERVSQYKWHAHFIPANDSVFARSTAKIGSSQVYMHRFITNAPKGMDVDHWSHDTLDNTRENLRICRHIDNIRNSRPMRRGSPGALARSAFKGVCLAMRDGRTKPWVSRIHIKGRQIYVGYFSSEIEAARAYDVAARELFGEFAYLNFPEEALS